MRRGQKSKIPHPNIYVEKGMLKEIETNVIKNNRIHISKIKTRYWYTSWTNAFSTTKFLFIVQYLIADIV